MLLRFSGLLLLICLSLGSSAQSEQFVVKFNGDTLRGRLQINPVRDNSHIMYFKHENGEKENLRPVRISYVYYDEEFQFRSVPFYNQRLFMQIIKEDERLSYYNYIHKRDNSIATTKVAVKPDGEALELGALSFKKQVKEFLDDCPSVGARIDNKEYRFKDLDRLFADYNNCDQQIMLVSGDQENPNSGSTSGAGSSEATPVVPSAATAPAVTTTPAAAATAEADDSKKAKLAKIDEFRGYVRGMQGYDRSRDMLEWITEIEYRVIEDRDIPNFLWSSLEEMSEGYSTLREKSNELQNALVN